jgi:hypothetical protein
LKTLDVRINKEIHLQNPIAVYQVGKLPIGYTSVDDFNTNAKANSTSVLALIKQRNAIKSEIVRSNALTEITVDGKVYTVAGAIERKNSIGYERELLNRYTFLYKATLDKQEALTKVAQNKLDSLIESTFGKDSKVDPENIKSISEQFWKQNEIKLADPLKLMDLITTMSNSIEEFISNVDVELTISNSTNFIEVE